MKEKKTVLCTESGMHKLTGKCSKVRTEYHDKVMYFVKQT